MENKGLKELNDAFIKLHAAFKVMGDIFSASYATGGVCTPSAKPYRVGQDSNEQVRLSNVTSAEDAINLARGVFEKHKASQSLEQSFIILPENEYYKLGLILIEQNELLRTSLHIAKRDGIQTNWEGFRNCLDKSLRKQFTFIPQFKCKHCFMPLTSHRCNNVVCNAVFHDVKLK